MTEKDQVRDQITITDDDKIAGTEGVIGAIAERVIDKIRLELAETRTVPTSSRRTTRRRAKQKQREAARRKTSSSLHARDKRKCRITHRKTTTTVRTNDETGVTSTETKTEVDEACDDRRCRKDHECCTLNHPAPCPPRARYERCGAGFGNGDCYDEWGRCGYDRVYRAFGRYVPRAASCQVENVVQPVCGALGCTLAQTNVVTCDTRPCWAPGVPSCFSMPVPCVNGSLLPYSERSIYEPVAYVPNLGTCAF